MKKISAGKSILLLSFILFISYACQKDNPQPASNNNNNTSADSISVSSFSPAQPYTDDTFIITGKNFNADATKDTVYFGVLSKTNFFSSHTCTVKSATATQLTVMIDYDPTKNTNPDFTLTNPSNGGLAKGFMIKTGGKVKVLTVPFKIHPSVYQVKRATPNTKTNGYAGCVYGSPMFYEGDSVLLDLTGCCKPFTITLNDRSLVWKFTDKSSYVHAAALIPIGFFGEAEPAVADWCPTYTDPKIRLLKFKVSNDDGKVTLFPGPTYQTPPVYFPAPNSQVVSVSLNAVSFSKSNPSAQPLFKITGYALRSTMQIRVAAMRNGVQLYNQVIGGIPEGYPNEYTQAVDLGALPDPPTGGSDNYVVSVFVDGYPYGSLFGGVPFTLTP